MFGGRLPGVRCGRIARDAPEGGAAATGAGSPGTPDSLTRPRRADRPRPRCPMRRRGRVRSRRPRRAPRHDDDEHLVTTPPWKPHASGETPCQPARASAGEGCRGLPHAIGDTPCQHVAAGRPMRYQGEDVRTRDDLQEPVIGGGCGPLTSTSTRPRFRDFRDLTRAHGGRESAHIEAAHDAPSRRAVGCQSLNTMGLNRAPDLTPANRTCGGVRSRRPRRRAGVRSERTQKGTGVGGVATQKGERQGEAPQKGREAGGLLPHVALPQNAARARPLRPRHGLDVPRNPHASAV